MNTLSKTLSHRWVVKTTRSSDDRHSIRYALYSKSSQPMTRCIVYINGRTEWIEKNMEIPDLLDLPDNCGFLTWDQRGQGASGGARSFIGSYLDYVLDARRVIEDAIGTVPYALIAHSMGGLVATHGCLLQELRPFKMVLASPLFRLPQEPIPNVIAKPLSFAFSVAGLGQLRTGSGSHHKSNFANNKLTHDFAHYQLICDSPYRIPSASFAWVNQTFKSCKEVFKPNLLAKLSAPSLVLSPAEETVVDPRGHNDWVMAAKKYAKVDVALKIIPGARHELFSETPAIRDLALKEIKTWLADFLYS